MKSASGKVLDDAVIDGTVNFRTGFEHNNDWDAAKVGFVYVRNKDDSTVWHVTLRVFQNKDVATAGFPMGKDLNSSDVEAQSDAIEYYLYVVGSMRSKYSEYVLNGLIDGRNNRFLIVDSPTAGRAYKIQEDGTVGLMKIWNGGSPFGYLDEDGSTFDL